MVPPEEGQKAAQFAMVAGRFDVPFGLFWRYLGFLAKLRLQGRIASVIEVTLRTVPMAYHLIEWGRLLREERAAMPPQTVPQEHGHRSAPAA